MNLLQTAIARPTLWIGVVAAVMPLLNGCQSPPPPEPASDSAEVRWMDHEAPAMPQRPPLYDDSPYADADEAEQGESSTTETPQAVAERRYPGDDQTLQRLTLKEAKVIDALRLISELTGINAAATREAGDKQLTLYLRDVSALEAIRTLCRMTGLWFRRDEQSGAFRVMTGEQYRQDMIVFRNDRTRVMKLRFPNALTAATAIEDLYGDRVELSLGIDGDELLFSRGGAGTGGLGVGSGFDDDGDRFDDDFSRSGDTASRFGRSTTSGSFSRGGRSGSRSRGSRNDDAFELREDLSAEQVARLAEQLESGADATAMLEALGRNEPPIYVTVNREHNLVIVRTTDEQAMDDIGRLVAQIDRPTPQVLLEMKILELEIGDTFRSIFDVSHTDGSESTGPDDGQPANPLNTAAGAAAANVLGAGNFAVEGGSFVYQFLDDNIRARIQLLQRDNRLNIVSSPLVLASNNRPARVFVGEERVLVTGVNTDVIVPEGGATTTVIQPITEVRDIGNSIIILPKINADRSVTLMVNQDTSSVSENSATIPVATSTGGIEEFQVDSVRTSQLQGVVVARHGLTVAIGGLIRSEVSDFEEKVPLLGDLPMAGTLFRKEERRRTKTELILLITPHVLKTPGQADATTRQRIKELSDHPYRERGDRTNREHFENVEERLEADSPFDPPER